MSFLKSIRRPNTAALAAMGIELAPAEPGPASDAAPLASDGPEEMQERVEAAVVEAAEAETERSKVLWDALQEQEERAARARAELAEAEANLERYKDDLAAKHRAEADAEQRAINVHQMQAIAGQQQERLAAIQANVKAVDDEVSDLAELAVAIIEAVAKHEHANQAFAQLRASAPGDLSTIRDEVKAGGVSLAGVDTRITHGFIPRTPGHQIPHGTVCAVSPLAKRVLDALLADPEVQSRVKAKLGNVASLQQWFPKPPARPGFNVAAEQFRRT